MSVWYVEKPGVISKGWSVVRFAQDEDAPISSGGDFESEAHAKLHATVLNSGADAATIAAASDLSHFLHEFYCWTEDHPEESFEMLSELMVLAKITMDKLGWTSEPAPEKD